MVTSSTRTNVRKQTDGLRRVRRTWPIGYLFRFLTSSLARLPLQHPRRRLTPPSRTTLPRQKALPARNCVLAEAGSAGHLQREPTANRHECLEGYGCIAEAGQRPILGARDKKGRQPILLGAAGIARAEMYEATSAL
jgi:hypothetical protein